MASQVYTFTARNVRANASRSHLHRHAFNKWRLWQDVDADVGLRYSGSVSLSSVRRIVTPAKKQQRQSTIKAAIAHLGSRHRLPVFRCLFGGVRRHFAQACTRDAAHPTLTRAKLSNVYPPLRHCLLLGMVVASADTHFRLLFRFAYFECFCGEPRANFY